MAGESTDDNQIDFDIFINDNNDIVSILPSFPEIMSEYYINGGINQFKDFSSYLNTLRGREDVVDEEISLLSNAEEYNFTRTYGATLNTDKIIEEYEDDLIYIPASDYCYLKIIEKIHSLHIDRKFFKPNESIIKIRRKLYEIYNINKLPRIFKWCNKTRKWKALDSIKNYKKNTDSTWGCFEIKIKKNLFHLCLFKDIKNKPDIVYIKSKFRIVINKNLYDNQRRLPKIYIPSKTNNDKIIIFDIETYVNENNKSLPYGMAFCELSSPQKIILYSGVDCLEQFVQYIDETYENITFQLFGHNAGKFDTIFFKAINCIKFQKQIKVGGSIISLKVKTNKNILVLKDSMKFFPRSLNKFCDSMNVEGKMDFKIHGWTINDYENSIEWKQYLTQDVKCLSESLLKLESIFNGLGVSIKSSLGLPGIGWKLCYFSSYRMRKDVYLPSDFVTRKFIRSSSYGGRVLTWRRKSSAPMKCYDANSLYPAVMSMFEYPVDKYQIMTQPLEYYFKFNYMFIADVTMDGCNRKYSLIPWRTDGGYLVYPSNKFRGNYTSVEIKSAINQGYKVEFHRGIFWWKKDYIFLPFINPLYEMRKHGNTGLKDVYKLIMNSVYGKCLQLITSCTKFSTEDNDGLLLSNGQYELNEDLETPIDDKPNYLGAFILSYARNLVTEKIFENGLENIYASDTDSIYTTNLNIPEDVDLGGFKNDYGENIIIEAKFLDIKRYCLLFNNGEIKVKFAGINFASGSTASDYLITKNISYFDFYTELYTKKKFTMKDLRFIRKLDHVVIMDKDIELSLSYENRVKIDKDDNNRFIPLDYDYDRPEFIPVYELVHQIKGSPVPSYEIGQKYLHANIMKYNDPRGRDLMSFSTTIHSKYYMLQRDGLYMDLMFYDGKYYLLKNYMPQEVVEILVSDKLTNIYFHYIKNSIIGQSVDLKFISRCMKDIRNREQINKLNVTS